MNPKDPRNECNDLEDFDLNGEKILKEPLDANKIWQDLSEICIPEEVIDSIEEYFQKKNTKHVISLAGGGAKGLIGNFALIHLLDQLNLMDYIDEIWGVSAGSIIGAAYCSGLKPIEILNLLIGIRNRDFIQFDGEGILKGGGILHSNKFHDFFDVKFQHRSMKEVFKPFFAIAVQFDGSSEQTHIFEDGLIADAITASMSVQDIFEPIQLNGINYVDGALIETAPSISVLQRHRKLQDPRQLAILGTCFGEEHFETSHRTIFGQVRNLMAVYRYQLQLDQMERVRESPNCTIGMIRLNIQMGRLDFAHLGNYILPTFQQLVQRISTMAMHRNFNELV